MDTLDVLKKALLSFRDRSVLVIGDVMLDQYTFGSVARISPEAPVPVVKKTKELFVLGGAANTANNVASLGAKTIIAGLVGNDSRKDKLLQLLLEGGISSEGLLVDDSRPTILKHRIVSEDYHQFLRLDEEDVTQLSPEKEEKFLEQVKGLIARADAVLLSDYAKGLFSPRIAQEIIQSAKQLSKLVVADIKPVNKELFRGVDVIKPNAREARQMTGADNVEEAGRVLTEYFGCNVVISRGQDGSSLFRKDGGHHHIPSKKIKVFDVSGAGDTFIAALTLALTSGVDIEVAAAIANSAGAVVVQKPGTATLSIEELLSALLPDMHVENLTVVPKLWGYEKWLENNERYCSKLLSLKKGYQSSLHYHKIKDETLILTEGHVRFELGDQILHMWPGNFVRVPTNTPHRFCGVENSTIIEVSTNHDEADVYRIEESREANLNEVSDLSKSHARET